MKLGQEEIKKIIPHRDPMLPGVYTVECMAQAADILLLST